MGNCCLRKSVCANRRVTSPQLHGDFHGRPTQQSAEDMEALLYIAPDICDVFFRGLRRPVCVPNSARDRKDGTKSGMPTASTGIDMEYQPSATEQHTNDLHQGQPGGDSIAPAPPESGAADLMRNPAEYPRIADFVLSRDLWRSRVLNRYKVTARYHVTPTAIGYGVGGSVREVFDRTSKHTYAMKTLRTFMPSRSAIVSAINEIAIYAQLDHPNIAFLHEAYEDVGVCHLIMEHCTGGELYDRLDSYKRFAEGYTKRLTVQMLLAINYLHVNGICHRDLKLENWVFGSSDLGAQLKMVDFGFSRLFQRGVPMGGTHGTVYYVDPEVIDGCYNEKCDVWSTGVIVYMLLSGSPPFNGDGDKEILWKIKRGPLKFEGARWSQVSDQAKEFITYLLNRNGTERASAYEALNHPWLSEEVQKFDDSIVTPEVMRHIAEFSKKSPLHRALVALCVLEADRNASNEIYRVFFAINTSRSGAITLKEFTDAMRKHLDMDENEAAAVFDTIAFRGTPTMQYTEFVAAVYEYYTEVDMELLAQVYYKLEALGNGRIDVNAFVACMGERFNGTLVASIFEDTDVERKGVIDFAQLQNCLVSVH
ncbi:calcium-dependent protein kinase, putative [Babesia bigemina]|uniref:Calcium-dependent protein kinase, putative n=1 Tax=Babesia bigemina TaxID=5866 RepID=A0A061CZ84_BABBI|nr:calcium-dependent protein kinase, putative [Babesia bigemina]CDR93936.1 calcium-dependent protein kinase, putative [Babesia bigemina]|eukprot:XP_012766122.1 calcium-dependent protein kinase, putative [Babesia bigemina]